MGKSPSIADLQAKDDAFNAYLTNLEADLSKKASAAEQQMQADITAFYTTNGYDDAKDFTSGSNTDFMHESEFSLDNLKNVIDAISKAVFSGAAVPTGATVDQQGVDAATAALGAEVGAMANLELYIAGKVFDVLSNVVLGFGASTSISYTSNTKSDSLGFGLQMFTTISASSYQSQSFFQNEYISQYLYGYDIRFSVEQAKVEMTMGLVQTYENALVNFEKRVDALTAEVGAGTLDGAAFETTVAVYNTLIDQYRTKIDQLKADPKLAS